MRVPFGGLGFKVQGLGLRLLSFWGMDLWETWVLGVNGLHVGLRSREPKALDVHVFGCSHFY